MKWMVSFLFVLFSVPVAQAQTQTQTPYAIWCADINTLYFTADGNTYAVGDTYNGQKITNVWSGTQISASPTNTEPSWISTISKKVTNIIFDSSFANIKPTSCQSWFYGCSKLSSITGLVYLNTSQVTNMSSMFTNCVSLTSLDLSNFDTSNVSEMASMFYHCSGLTTLDLSNFDTNNVTGSMVNMFNGCSGLTTLNISNFNTIHVTNMSNMFTGCSNLTSLDVTSFDTSNVTKMEGMFSGCSGLTSLNVSNFNTGNVTNMVSMFSNCSSLETLDLSNFNTSNMTAMYSMFSNCSSLIDLDVTSFNTINVSNMQFLFSNCSSLTTLDVSGFDTNNVITMKNMFSGCSQLESIDVSNFNTENVTNMYQMFCNCSSLTSLDLTSFDTSNVTSMNQMFINCENLTSIDVSSFNTNNMTEMTQMFYNCSKLHTIISNKTWSAKAGASSGMFFWCYELYGEYGARAKKGSVVTVNCANPSENGYFTKTTEELTANAYNGKYYTTYYNAYVGSMADENTTVYKAELSEDKKSLALVEIEDKIINPGQAVILESTNSSITLTRKIEVLDGGAGDFSKNALSAIDYRDIDNNYMTTQTVNSLANCQNATIYTMGLLDTDNDGVKELGFFKFVGSTLKARRAYLTLPDGNEAGYRFSFDEDTPTAISLTPVVSQDDEKGSCYNLAGQRVAQPTKGLYIVNGKKVYIK